MKKIMTLFLLVTIIGVMNGCSAKNEDNKTNPTMTSDKKNENTTALYLVKIDNKEETSQDNLSGAINCNENNLVRVALDSKLTPRETLEKLFNYKDYDKQKMTNYLNKVVGLKINDLILKNDFATLKLADTLTINDNKTINHEIVPCIDLQIKKTLQQFNDITGTDIYVGDEILINFEIK